MTPLQAPGVYYALSFLRSIPGRVVFDLYLVQVLHLSPLELLLVATAGEAAAFVAEIPTGAVADVYGRKLSFVVGCTGMGLAMLGVGLVSTGSAVIALWALWGLAYTFTSGAFEAWIADEVGPARVGVVFLRGARWRFAGALAGIAAMVAIGLVSLRAGVIAGGALDVACGLACIVAMPETAFVRRARGGRGVWTAVAAGVRFVRGRTLVLVLVATQVFAGAGAAALDVLPEAHVLRDVGVPHAIRPVVLFGAVAVASLVFGVLLVGRVIGRVERGGIPAVARLLVAFTAATIGAQLVFALAPVFAVVIAAWVVALFTRSLLVPLFDTWLNRQITDSSVRATVLSISGQANAVGRTGGGPAIGAIGNGFGIPAALVAGALLVVPTLALYARALRHHGREPELEAVAETI